MLTNPFNTPITTIDLSASDAVELFSDVFKEFHILLNPGHTFLNGSRGSGKTMMFRLMQPDCMLLRNSCTIQELKFIAIYIGIRDIGFNKTEFVFLQEHADAIISEHYLTVRIAALVFHQLAGLNIVSKGNKRNLDKLLSIYKESFEKIIYNAGWKNKIAVPPKAASINDIFNCMSSTCIEILEEFNKFSDNLLTNANKNITYDSIILKYSNFLLPLLEKIKSLHFMPIGKPIYLMLDDADNLNNTQKQILNTWISSRNINTVSFKISTQLNYKYFKTLYSNRIETPHDYSEINIADRYTSSNRSFYKDRIKDVVGKRLKKIGLKKADPYAFFPFDKRQEDAIDELFNIYYKQQLAAGKSKKQAYDFAYRYARPDYIRDKLKGNRNTYSYAGFDQLVHLSSGNMRQFIEPAKNMYDIMITEESKKNTSQEILSISPTVQDKEIRDYSYKSLRTYFDNLKKEKEDEINMVERNATIDGKTREIKKHEIKTIIFNLEKLNNLINALGKLFNRILLSTASERRVFSIALNDEPDEELKRILDLGVELGFLQEYAIGNKYGTGKSRLYILNRIISPNFGLDPSSFAGYKFVNCDVLKKAIMSPTQFDRHLKSMGIDMLDKEEPTLFSQVDDYAAN